MSSFEEVGILVQLRGTTEFIRNAGLVTASMDEMQVAADETGLAMERTGRRGMIMNQAMFTARRLMYGVTLAAVATGVAAVRMGFGFNSAMQQARIALRPVSRDLGGVQDRLTKLWNFTKYTPFQFKDMTIAFRSLYLGFRTVGISANTTQLTLKSMVDALAASGRDAPGYLNRVSVALQHMAYQGHLTGYTVNQLARDGIPIFAALRRELHLTGDQIHQIGTLGIPTRVALNAINKFIETYPGTANMAYKQATGSLHGLFTTFKDNISQLFGNMESGVFARFQKRLVDFNAFFGRISNSMQRHSSFSAVIGQAFGGGAEFIWKRFASDLSLVWRIFTGLIGTVLRSKPLWAEFATLLIILHGILSPINWILQHFGWLISNLIIPAMVAELAITKSLIIWEGIRKYLLASTVAEGRALTLGMYAMRAAMIAYYFVLGRVIVLMQEWWQVQSALKILMTGQALDMGYYRALTSLELMALKLRTAFMALWAPFAAVIGETWAFTAALLANPITWIVLGVLALTAGLIVLYIKWKAFRDIVNETIGWIWRHPLVSYFIPVIGQFVVMARLAYLIYKHFHDLMEMFRHPVRTLQGWWHGITGYFGGMDWNPLSRGFWPHLASGGTIMSPGTVMVGEQGPELLNLPRGASVIPLSQSFGGGGDRQPLQINLMINQRVLESILVDIVNGRLAQA